MDILAGLNPEQLDAVTTPFQKVLVLAGAGTGKTTVLTKRIVYICNEHRISGSNIMCLTFTNKASREMKTRLMKLLPEKEVNNIWCGTFHSICLRILRECGHKIGYKPNISVYTPDDAVELLAQINEEYDEGLTEKEIKNLLQMSKDERDKSKNLVLREFYYRLKKNNAVTFDLMLSEVQRVFKKCPEILEQYHKRFKYIFVDEYQDTDWHQYNLHMILDPDHLFVVGDTDQAIYKWRGAVLEIILNFQKDHQQSKVIILSRNYRSLPDIIKYANKLIEKNENRFDKTLIPVREGKAVVYINVNKDAEIEKFSIKDMIGDAIGKGFNFKDIAILYRKNAQGNDMAYFLEQRLIPFIQVSSKVSVWGTTAARECINALWLLHNQDDNYRAERFIKKVVHLKPDVVSEIQEKAAQRGCPLLKVYAEMYAPTCSGKFPHYDGGLLDLINSLYLEFAFMRRFDKYPEIRETYTNFAVAVKEWAQENGDLVDEFLSFMAFQSDQDVLDTVMKENKIKLMTVHGAKGLEFPVVIIIGCEDGTFPIKRSDPEEERRVFYVAITRAMNEVYFTSSAERVKSWGSGIQQTRVSPFLNDMFDDLSVGG